MPGGNGRNCGKAEVDGEPRNGRLWLLFRRSQVNT